MAERSSSRKRGAKKAAAADPVGDATTNDELTGGTDVRTALISGNTFRAKAVQYSAIDGLAMFEGDIVLGELDQVEAETEMLRAEQRGEVALGVIITGDQFRWPNCTVPYDIDPALPNQARVTDAIAHWQSNTRFTFVLRTPANAASYPDWVTFRPSSGCSSSVGRRGGQQFVNLGSGCTTGNTIHEIGHAVGLWHEQSREDRDAFVTINWANIQAGFEHNFNQHIVDGDDVGAYDYGSIMHYPRSAFGVGGAETITPTNPAAVIGQRTALSAGDIATANSMCPKGFETLKEFGPETLKERFPETIKEQIETLKETKPETLKERFPETIKEVNPETVKEQFPETVKEQIPETRKELIETIAEGIGTRVETINPGGLGGTVINPGNVVVNPGNVLVNPDVGGAMPFAMTTAHAGQAQAAVDPLEARLGAIEQALLDMEAGQAALAQQLAALLGQSGLA